MTQNFLCCCNHGLTTRCNKEYCPYENNVYVGRSPLGKHSPGHYFYYNFLVLPHPYREPCPVKKSTQENNVRIVTVLNTVWVIIQYKHLNFVFYSPGQGYIATMVHTLMEFAYRLVDRFGHRFRRKQAAGRPVLRVQ